MRRNIKRKLFVICFFVILSSFFLIIHNTLYIIFEKDDSYCDKIGIIDGSLCNDLTSDIIYMGDYCGKQNSHGEKLIELVEKSGFSGTIYYYSAENQGVIRSADIVCGLEWMKEQGVKKVNISMSTKKYDKGLEEWLIDNPEITVFCSYNNLANSSDFPAMYPQTIASGAKNGISRKKQDKMYPSNRVIILGKDGISFYSGNSFLSILTMLDYSGD